MADKENKKSSEELPSKLNEDSEIEIPPEVAEAIKKLSPHDRNIVIQSVQAIKKESFSGPIPHPELLQGYENVCPGFAERIVRMAEKEQEHRFEFDNRRLDCDNKIIDGSVAESKRGQVYGLIASILMLGGSVALGFGGHDVLGGVLGGTTLIGLVTVFVTGRNNHKEDSDK